jgi:hypothetical protein
MESNFNETYLRTLVKGDLQGDFGPFLNNETYEVEGYIQFLTIGNLIYTTAEIITGEVLDVNFSRKLDSLTTYNELFIEKKIR